MRQRQSGQKKQKSKDLGTDSSSQDWKAAQQSWSMYLGRWRLGTGRGRREDTGMLYRP